MSDRLMINSSLRKTPVAIIGLAGIFPQAENLQEYWDNIVKEVDSITEVPPSRWCIEDYYDPDPTAPDKTYCKRGGFIPDIDFNPIEFGLPPNILEVTDVSQLLSLVVATQAIKDAGYGNGREFDRTRTGVVLGVGGGQKLITPLTSRLQYPVWDRVLESSGIPAEERAHIIEKMKLAYIRWEENSFPGMLGNVIAGRVANRLDLGGMNCVVDAACAASLAAVKMAVTELTDYRADTMITGGVDTDNSIFMYMSFSKTPAFSQRNDIRPFDADADGMMIGEGVGMLVLKRLEDAERDHDRIYAVIKGIGTSSDGRYKSIYAPRASGQAVAVSRAYEDAGFSAATVGLVEAHGTGTAAGDPTEFAGLNEVFSHNNPHKQHIALGSVKSQIGHTKAAAGAASLIKTALALHHRILPPTLNVAQPNPKMDIESTPFYLNTRTRPWLPRQDGTPRRAGVSAFGFGGTNFHFALEEYRREHDDAYRLHKTPQAVFLAAPSPTQLVAECESKLAALRAEGGQTDYQALVAASKTLQLPTSSARLGFVSDSLAQAVAYLETAVKLLKTSPATTWNHPKGIFYRQNGMVTKGKVVALFPGQGSQYLEMGKELALNFPPIREAYAQIDALFAADGQAPLSSVIFPVPAFTPEEKRTQIATLRRTEFVQPAIGAFSIGLYKLLQQAGFTPDFTAGHSFGELTALWAGGVLDDAAYFYLAKARGQAMSAPDGLTFDAGTMMAVKGDLTRLSDDMQGLDGVVIANYNSNEQVVLAGSNATMPAAQRYLETKGYVVTPLSVSAAFHTPFVQHAQRPFTHAIEHTSFAAPRIPVYGNSTGQPYPTQSEAIQTSLNEHILKPVLFRQEIENIYEAGGTIFVEIGPRQVLTNLVKDILGDRPHMAVAVNASRSKSSDRQLREAYVQLCVAGLPLRTLDPYAYEFETASNQKKSLINVNLAGNNYVSTKTQSAYVEALQGNFPQPQMAESAAPAPAVPAAAPAPSAPVEVAPPSTPAPIPPSIVPLPITSPAPIVTNGHVQEPLPKQKQKGATTMNHPSAFLERVEKSLDLLHQHQAETARVHETYLKGQEAYAQSVVQLLQQIQGMTANHAPAKSQQTASTPQSETPPTPTPQLTNGFVKEKLQPLPPPVLKKPAVTAVPKAPALPTTPPVPLEPKQEAPSPVAKPVETVPAIPAAAPTIPTDTTVAALAQAMLVVVSEKTGYPVEMLEMGMDMESDLGIDSIKRVEILGAMQKRHPELPEVNPADLAELRTLQQIVDHLQPAVASAAPSPSSNGVSQTATEPVTAVSTTTPTDTTVAALAQAMLVVVSEKTGYPVEMLEMGMDMESDLGIDSIKRVEILGAMQKRHPELPEVNPADLAELRTLQQIVDHLQPAVASAAPSPSSNGMSQTAAEPVTAVSTTTPTDTTVAALAQAMLVVVSEKTGYPVEMLEMGMDMESDLGIDSIKRVEILGAMQKRHPELPEVNPADLAELRTLQQIVDHLQVAPMGMTNLGKADPATAGAGFSTNGKSVPAPTNHAITRYLVTLKKLPMPDFLAFAPPETACCLLTDDGITTAHVAQALVDRGWRVAVLRFPQTIVPAQSVLPTGIGCVTLADMSEAQLQQQLTAVATQFGPIGSFIHLHPTTADTTAVLQQVFFIAGQLKKTLNEAAQQHTRASFLTVTRMDGALGLDGEIPFQPTDGGLFGLTKTINLEWPHVYCRAIDLHPTFTSQQVAAYVLAELHDPNCLITEVGYGNQGRVTLDTVEASFTTYTPDGQITPASLFVVSGGGRGITAQCVIYLAQQYQCKFVLLGRSSLHDVDTSWLGDYADEAALKRLIMEHLLAKGEKPTPMLIARMAHTITAKREIEQTLRSIQQAGSQVEYVSVDVTDNAALREALTAVSRHFGPITGIIHGAGVLSDKLIEKKTEQDFTAVYATKVTGLQALLQAVSPSQLQHLVLFSSAAGFYGNVGQADYALANEILNKTAHLVKQQHPGCHVVAINWGPWDGGMVTPSLKQFFAEREIPVIPVDVGAWLLAHELTAVNHHITQTVVGGALSVPGGSLDERLRQHRIHRFLSLEANPFLQDHVIGRNPVLPTVCAIAWMGNLCEQLYPGYTMFRCDNYQVLKGIVFDEHHAAVKEYVLDLEETRKTNEEIAFNAIIWSQNEDGKTRYHYRAQITLMAKLPDAPLYTGFDNSEVNAIDQAALYQNGTLFHGPDFQGVARVLHVTLQKVTMRCQLAALSDTEQGQFPVQSFNPFIADGQFQSMVIWARHFHNAGSLPLHTDCGEQYRSIPFGATTYVSMEVKESGDNELVADILTHDENGRLYARVLGAKVTISKQLNHLFVPAVEN